MLSILCVILSLMLAISLYINNRLMAKRNILVRGLFHRILGNGLDHPTQSILFISAMDLHKYEELIAFWDSELVFKGPKWLFDLKLKQWKQNMVHFDTLISEYDCKLFDSSFVLVKKGQKVHIVYELEKFLGY